MGRLRHSKAPSAAPDHTQWHCFFELAENFFFKFLPEATHVANGDPTVLATIRKVRNMGEHAWLKGTSPEERAKIEEFYQERYGTTKVQ